MHRAIDKVGFFTSVCGDVEIGLNTLVIMNLVVWDPLIFVKETKSVRFTLAAVSTLGDEDIPGLCCKCFLRSAIIS